MSYESHTPTVDKLHRMLSIQDYPEKAEQTREHHRKYALSHDLDISGLINYSAYLTEQGICFCLYEQMGYQERITAASAGPRFLYPSGVEMRKALYYPAEGGDELFVVEGTADALAVAQLGFRAVSMLGSMVTQQKVDRIRGLIRDKRKTFLVPDKDMAGMGAVGRVYRAGLCVRVVNLPPPAKDVCDLSQPQREDFLRRLLLGKEEDRT